MNFIKKKGFTLVELLGIILIFTIVSIISVITVSNILNNCKNEIFNQTVIKIMEAGRNYKSYNETLGIKLKDCVVFDFENDVDEIVELTNMDTIYIKKQIPIRELRLEGNTPNVGKLIVCESNLKLDGKLINDVSFEIN